MKVRNMNTGAVFPATPRLVRLTKQRKDLELVDDGQPLSAEDQAKIKEIEKKEPVVGDRKAGTKTAPEPEPKPKDEDGPSHDGDSSEETAEDELDLDALEKTVKSLKGKDKLEALVLENFGVNLDKRKGLDTLKAMALELIEGARG